MHRGLTLWISLTILGLSAFAADGADTQAMTGCLDQSDRGFLLKHGDHNVELTGEIDFAKHIGHTVKITGEPKGATFAVRSLEHVAPQCNGVDAAKTGAVKDGEAAGVIPKLKDDGPTAQDQGSGKADLETAAAIRRAIVADDALSTYAHNVKVIVRDGKVTLRGPVRSAEEKASLIAKAEAVAGEGAADDRMTIEPASDIKDKR